MILIPLINQDEFEKKHLELMEKVLPFYPSEIYGDPSRNNSNISAAKQGKIKDARRLLYKYEKLYRFIYLKDDTEPYPPSNKDAETKFVYKDRLRQLLVGRTEKMTQGNRRNELVNIINSIGELGNSNSNNHNSNSNNNNDNSSEELIKRVFKYSEVSRRDEEKETLKNLGVEVCPYCNRAFTSTIIKRKEIRGVRPQLDHYFPKTKYPYLAVNFYNLIPSCGICNQNKGHIDTYKYPIMYPFDEGLGTEYRFVTYPDNSSLGYLYGELDMNASFSLQIEPIVNKIRMSEMDADSRKDFEKRIKNSIEFFKLRELYSSHLSYAEIILRNGHIYKQYLPILQKNFPDAKFSLDDIKTIMYCQDIRQDQWYKNILSKMKNDLDYEVMR